LKRLVGRVLLQAAGSLDKGCRLVEQGFQPGSCLVYRDAVRDLACRATLKWEKGIPYRLIHSYAHKAPECYLSIYQSGCNWSCKKCHSWRFSQHASGEWMSPTDIATLAKKYAELHKGDMYREPKERATSWHAHDLCHTCGSCILRGERSKHCPRKLSLDQMTLLDNGVWGPARNIISFTGGDLACQPEFYERATTEIKNLEMDLWVLFETNGYGLTPRNLDLFSEAGIDSFWLDIKAYDEKVHKNLTGASNKWILRLPSEIFGREFTQEVSSVYIPGWVETDELRSIAASLAQVDPEIPYAIIAFLPEHQLSHVPPPSFQQMVEAYNAARDSGLKKVRLDNIGLFVRTTEEYEVLASIGAV